MKINQTILIAAIALSSQSLMAQTDEPIKTYTFPNGDIYVGQMKNGKFDGHGVYTYANGQKYDGEWREGQMEGRGTFSWTNGNRYEGEFHAGLRHGEGTYYYAGGDKFSGEWRNGIKDGHGVYTYADGATESGVWKGNDLIEPDNATTVSTTATAAVTSVDQKPLSQSPAAVSNESSETSSFTLHEASQAKWNLAFTRLETHLLSQPEATSKRLSWVPELGRVAFDSITSLGEYTEVFFIDRNITGFIPTRLLSHVEPIVPTTSRSKVNGVSQNDITADVTIHNTRSSMLTVWFGEQKYTVKPQQKTLLGNMVPGTYTIRVMGRNIVPEISNETIDSGKKYIVEL